MIRIGMLTPSSNTVLEPVTADLLRDVCGVSVHFSRFKVTEIALDAAALNQFDDAPILAAADLLAHAKVDVVCWNGTSASWLGIDRDRALVGRIEAATGVPAATCVLGLLSLARALDLRLLGLVTPYLDDVQSRIRTVYAAEGLPVAAERHLSLRDNFSFATVDEATIEAMTRAVLDDGADSVAILCTNMRGARLAAALERERGVPILDSVAVALWAALARIGASPGRVRGAGRLFEVPAAAYRG